MLTPITVYSVTCDRCGRAAQDPEDNDLILRTKKLPPGIAGYLSELGWIAFGKLLCPDDAKKHEDDVLHHAEIETTHDPLF